MANNFWSELHSKTSVHFSTPGAFADHSPAAVVTGPRLTTRRRSFKFFIMWTAHDGFLDLIANHWQSNVTGSPMYTLCRRLKLLKLPLKQLNNLHFSHISARVIRAESELHQHQSLLHDDRDNPQLLMQDKHLRLSLVNLKSLEKMFYGQKLKSAYLKECDKGSKFFHAMMRQKQRRNFTPAIVCSNGLLSSSMDEVGGGICQILPAPSWLLKIYYSCGCICCSKLALPWRVSSLPSPCPSY